MGNMKVVPANVAGQPSATPLAGAEAKELEELWTYFSQNPGMWGHWEGTSKVERETFKASANAYLRNRPEGALKLRQIRRQNLPDNEMKFIIEPLTATAE